MSVNVPSSSLRYSAAVVPAASRSGQAVPLTNRMSCQPSASTSSQSAPEPKVSGMYLAPNAPFVWVNVMPACSVISVKTTGVAAGRTATHPIATAAGARRRLMIRL